MADAVIGCPRRWTGAWLLLLLLVPACAESNLRRAVANGELGRTRHYIEGERQSPELPNPCGWTLLHYASYYQHTPLVEYLLSRSVDVNAQTASHSGHCIAYSHIPAGSTALVIAAYYGQTDVIRALLQFGAKRRVRNAEGYDALMYARKYEFAEAARLLEARPAD